MHAPPPAGRTGRAPPGAGGGAGAVIDEAALCDVAAPVTLSPPHHPAAMTSTAATARRAGAAPVPVYLTLLTIVSRAGIRTDALFYPGTGRPVGSGYGPGVMVVAC